MFSFIILAAIYFAIASPALIVVVMIATMVSDYKHEKALKSLK